MKGVLLIIALMSFGGLWVWAMQRPSSWQVLLSQTVEQGEVDTLFAELQRKPELVQPRFFDEAMHRLGDFDESKRLMGPLVEKAHSSATPLPYERGCGRHTQARRGSPSCGTASPAPTRRSPYVNHLRLWVRGCCM